MSINKSGNYGLGVMFSRVGTKNYMAPELLEKRPYRGTCVDIFAAGVVLFVMNTGTWPFEKSASIHDPIYKHIVEKRLRKETTRLLLKNSKILWSKCSNTTSMTGQQ